MATLERVIQMKQQGMSEDRIISSLREEGISPKEINEAVSQSKIKMALNQEPRNDIPEVENTMQQSIMNTERPVDEEGYTDYSGNTPAPNAEQTEQSPQEYQQDQEYYPEYQPDSAYPEYQPPPSIDIETVNEIAEQIIEEKVEKIAKQISGFTKFKEDIQTEIQRINERLTKMEEKFEELQMAIIKKVGQYGENIQEISKEMHATQQSFSKILDPLTDNIRQLQKITGNYPTKKQEEGQTPTEQAQPRKVKKPEPGFEDYLR